LLDFDIDKLSRINLFLIEKEEEEEEEEGFSRRSKRYDCKFKGLLIISFCISIGEDYYYFFLFLFIVTTTA